MDVRKMLEDEFTAETDLEEVIRFPYPVPQLGHAAFEAYIESQLVLNQYLYESPYATKVTIALSTPYEIIYVPPPPQGTLGDYIYEVSLVASKEKATRLFIPRMTMIGMGSAGSSKNLERTDVDDERLKDSGLELTEAIFWYAQRKEGAEQETKAGAMVTEGDGRVKYLVDTPDPKVAMFNGILS